MTTPLLSSSPMSGDPESIEILDSRLRGNDSVGVDSRVRGNDRVERGGMREEKCRDDKRRYKLVVLAVNYELKSLTKKLERLS